MGLLALEAGMSGFVYQTQSIDEFLFWYMMQLIIASFLPAL